MEASPARIRPTTEAPVQVPYPADFEATLAFHGHLCLDIAVGYRVAKAALEALKAEGADTANLVATVGNDTCAVDAIQRVTGCTLGKRNLVPRLTGKAAYVLQDAATGKGVRLYVHFWEGFDPEGRFRSAMRDNKAGRLGPDAAAEFQADQEALIRHILEAPDADLFTMRPATGAPPPRSGGFSAHPCMACGEYVKEGLLEDGRCAECHATG